MIKGIKRFFTKDLWDVSLKSLSGTKLCISYFMRICYLTIQGFIQDKCALRAASLTYYSLMGIVPILALAFAIAKGFGYQEMLENELITRFSEQKIAIEKLIVFSKNVIDKTKGSLLALLGILITGWSLIKVLNHIESAFNQVWGVKKQRSIKRKFSDYFAMMLIGPVFFVVASSVTVFIVSKLTAFIESLPLYTNLIAFFLFLLKLAPFVLIWILFTFIYLFMPNKRVPFLSALIGGVVAGTAYQILQWFFIYFQIGVTRYSAIYGSFAFLPLFLIWLQLSWLVVLAGAEICFSIDHVESYEQEKRCADISMYQKALISVWICHKAIVNLIENRKPIDDKMIQKELNIPFFVIGDITDRLIALELLTEVASKDVKSYLPVRMPSDFRIKDVLIAISGKEEEIFLKKNLAVKDIEKTLESFSVLVEGSDQNKLLKDLNHE